MFKSGSKQAGDATKTDTVIGEGTRLEGKLVSSASVRVQGNLQGEIECAGDVTVAVGSVVQADIKARNVINAGTVKGSLHARGSLTVTPSGKLYGDVVVQSLIVEDGGLLQGICMMGDEETERVEEAKDNVQKLEKRTKETQGEDTMTGTG